MDANVHQFSAKLNGGEEISLSQYKGKALLIVNTASKCGFTPQYASLEKLYEQYRDKGFEVLAFPANDFMWQEPGTNEEIKKFCSLKYGTTFPLFEKITVKGKDQHPLYHYLTEETSFSGAISWNFNKFLVDQEGHVVGRFGSKVDPMSDELTQQIDALLKNNSN